MSFNSIQYAIFLPLVVLAFHLASDRYRWMVLLVASYGFYAFCGAPHLLVVLALVTLVSYVCGTRLGATADDKERKSIFWLGTAACVLILAAAKYLPSLSTTGGADSSFAGLASFVGVSYFTIQAISYLADVYIEIQEPERNLGYHALSLAFFPKLLQGPIERAGDLLPQLKKTRSFDYDAVRSGLLLFAFGLFKKVVVADRLGIFANQVFDDVHAYTGPPLIMATYVYALQVYFDFAGYTDMARGTGRLFGIELTENFRSPYLATSIADFWRRWHISFSRWLLDYVFKPLQLGWRDRGRAGTALALLVTFLVSGIWHGASAGFVIWGLLHGIYLAASTYWSPYQRRLYAWLGVEKSRYLKVWQTVVTFNLVSFAWIFFRAASLKDAWYVVNNLFLVTEKSGTHHRFTMVVVALVMVLAERIFADRARRLMTNTYARWAVYVLLIQAIILCGVHRGDSFVYFRF